ncbi:MAG: DUF4922 domain-containing protein [bacterium]|nr:DUF4922 domain-containing protein [bacterium]MDD3624848.1 DUF4922 domain-containing protein [Proteiniphilum sp.]MDD3967524.1 DUF4922 domain-containing protein [Proteiniphilum sp.]MDD4459158.1 DUF4922 domain-containing protein [Proteiniphilum sp.]
MNLQRAIEDLFSAQKEKWPQLRDAVERLAQVRERSFLWGDDFRVRLQFNPSRMISAAARLESEEISRRPCFLCAANRPTLQRGIPFLEKYVILCNPFPILHNHLTIPLHSHVPQRIGKKTGEMLALAEQLPDYVVFYNGPACGASAPDHYHLQAGLKMTELLQGDHELRSCMMIESESRSEAEELFEDVYSYLRQRQPDREEPMINLIAFISGDRYHLHLFPRKAHRPRQYNETGSRQLLISPGALDMAGVMITVREEDFNKLEQHDIEDIYSQVSLPVM